MALSGQRRRLARRWEQLSANPPAKQFWSVTVYDEKNRQMLVNETKRLEVSSRNPAVVKNADGSTDVYVGPTAPKGFEQNWVQTKPGEGLVRALPLLQSHREDVRQELGSVGFRKGEVIRL
jgi:hypothetical protein